MQTLITAYLFDGLGVFAGTTQIDPASRVPENSTFDAPPVFENGHFACWNGSTWISLDSPPGRGTDLDILKAAKNDEIDGMRAAANASSFPFGSKQIACDALSRSDIDGVANHIALCGTFPAGFPGGWKATDKNMLPLPDVDAFRAMYAAMTEQGTRNFNHSQELKTQLAAASTPEEVAAIVW